MASVRSALIHCQRAGGLIRASILSNCSYSPASTRMFENPGLLLSARFSAGAEVDGSSPINPPLDENRRRLLNRLSYRSKQRGFLELDLVLGKWVEENIHTLDDNQLKALVEVLDLENPYLWKWLTAQEPAPEAVMKNPVCILLKVFSLLHEKILKNLNAYASPETRAKPGQPWVRGWDDKRGLDGPVTGNQ